MKRTTRSQKMADDANDHAAASEDLAAKLAPLLAGHPPGVQGAALADLLAIYLAGHIVPDDKAETAALRETLIPVNEAMIAERLKQEGVG